MKTMRALLRARRSALAAAAFCLWAVAASAQVAKPITVILVRHAEKAAEPASDPPLTAEGEARARDLWQAVKDAGISAVITTQFARTRGTAQPTAAALGLSPEIVSAGGADHPKDVAAAVRRHEGQTVLVVGHSNTIPAIIEALGAPKPAAICDPEYDNLYVVGLAPGAKATLIRTKFGARTPVGAECARMTPH